MSNSENFLGTSISLLPNFIFMGNAELKIYILISMW